MHARWLMIASIASSLGLTVGLSKAGAQESEGAPAALEATARAQVSAADLADSLRSIQGPLRSTELITANPEALTKEDNDRLIESAAKDQLARTADELDQLSAALAAGAAPELTMTLLESLSRRAAGLSELGQRTDQVLIPPEELEALGKLWIEVRALSAADSSSIDTQVP